MIPKIIHYCWFGRNPLPASAQKCIDSWKKYFPDYEIKEWNEDNFDVNRIPYSRDAYAAKKFAFVSDYARFWILYYMGGVYFDIDVEVIHPMDDLIEKGPYMGWEKPDMSGRYTINPGLGLAMPQTMPLCKEILNGFEQMNFYKEDGTISSFTMIRMITDMLKEKGLAIDGTLQEIDGATIYPSDYFCPMNSLTGKTTITENTRSIHRYQMSWFDKKDQNRLKVTRFVRRVLAFFKGK